MYRILLYGHAGNHNRGCEAIVRGTQAVLQSHLAGSHVRVATNDFAGDTGTDLGPALEWVRARILGRAMTRFPLRHLAAAERRLFGQAKLSLALYRPTLEAGIGADAAFSIGGDNYSESPAVFLTTLDHELRKRCRHMVLWGCSLDPQRLDSPASKLANIGAFDLITPRETITYEGLIERGITADVHLHADPAFLMEPSPADLPAGFEQGNTIGLNVSPLLRKFEARDGGSLRAAVALVQHVISQTDLQVLLVPHVVLGSDDRIPLGQIYDCFRHTGRVLQLDSALNSPQTKYVISQCRLFIGARTHSTIAAYGTGVPTLALGYSVKARGIARDIFGSEEGLVLPVQQLTDARQLIRAFEALREREDELRQHLASFMPGYIQSAWDAGAHVAELLR